MNKTKTNEIYKTLTNGKMTCKAAAGQNESVPADGESLVDQPTIDVLAPNFMLNSIYENCNIINIDNTRNSNGITIPLYDVTTVDDDGFYGVNANWTGEAALIEDSTIKFVPKNLKLNKLVVSIPATNEILEDAPALVTYVNNVGSEAMNYKIDRAIIYGDSTYSMGGVVGSDDDATIYVTEGANKLSTIQSMVSSYYGGQDGVWVVSQDVFAQIVTEFADKASACWCGEVLYLYGYPVKKLACANKNTLLLGDFSQYQIVQKELRKDISEHVYFDTDQSVIKLVARLQGTPLWNSTMTLENSGMSSQTGLVELAQTINTSKVELLDTITNLTSGFVKGGVATYYPISASTFTVDVSSGGYTLLDNGSGVLSAASLPVSGAIDYNTGTWLVDFTNQEVLTVGTEISATYDITTYTANGTLSLVGGVSSYVPGSISMDISSGGYTLTEVAAGVLGVSLSTTNSVYGTIDLDGTWTVNFTNAELLTNGTEISATYAVDYPTSVSTKVAPFVALASMPSNSDKY